MATSNLTIASGSPLLPSGVSAGTSTPEDIDDYDSDLHVYEPHRAGLPPLQSYFQELWRRREFALEMARSSMRAAHSDTVFGRLWNVLNPLLLAMVYYLLVDIISRSAQPVDYFPHLLGGLFVYYYISGAISGGALSVISARGMVLNTPFPRLLLPLSALYIAFIRFLPTMIIYFISHLATHRPFGVVQLMLIPMLVLITMFGAGAAMVFATLEVYFRDTSSFLPYALRIWLYVSPVLFFPETVPGGLHQVMEIVNPAYGLIGGWTELLVRAQMPPASMWVSAAAWSAIALVGGAYYFISRERDFAVRVS